MHNGYYDFPFDDDVQARRQRYEKAENKTKKKYSTVKRQKIKPRYNGKYKDKTPDGHLRKQAPFYAHNNNEKQQKKNFYPRVQFLKEPFLVRCLPLDIGGLNKNSETFNTFIDE
jgi:hypothetical protein